MINLNLRICFPFRKHQFYNLFCKTCHIYKHKYIEIQCMYVSQLFLGIGIDWSVNTDHAGVTAFIGLFGYECQITLYDSRHWDEENNDWYNYG